MSKQASNKNQKQTKSTKFWLVGGSHGIGLKLTAKLLDSGHQVLVSARNCEKSHELLKLAQDYPEQLKMLNVDVADAEKIDAKVRLAWQMMNGIDTWFYNAGIYESLTLNDWDIKQFERMNSINYLGCVRLMIALKPLFLKQSFGTWIWNISLASDFGLPYGGAYSAPKAALMNLAESIQPELKQNKINLKVINHGFVKTRLSEKNDFPMLGLMTAEAASEKIFGSLDNKQFETRFPNNLASLLGVIKRLPKS